MAIPYQSSNNKFLSIKVLLVSTSVLSMALMLKLSMPVIMEFTLSELPSIWSFLISWLRPPYLYVLINCIIITIVASSRLQSKVDNTHHPLLSPETAEAAALLHTDPVKVVPPADVLPDYSLVYGRIVPKNEAVEVMLDQVESGYVANFVEVPEPELYASGDASAHETKRIAVNASEESKSVSDELTMSNSFRSASHKDCTDFSSRREKPPASARFGHRKFIKASPEGGWALGVAKPKRQDTLESTWKTITEGRAMPLTRHLRKSDTWETHGRRHQQQKDQVEQDHQRMSKSETFNLSQTPPPATGLGKLKKEPSLGQDELNKRVEAFIRKFNEDMRLQRQESLDQYMEMINRGASTAAAPYR